MKINGKQRTRTAAALLTAALMLTACSKPAGSIPENTTATIESVTTEASGEGTSDTEKEDAAIKADKPSDEAGKDTAKSESTSSKSDKNTATTEETTIAKETEKEAENTKASEGTSKAAETTTQAENTAETQTTTQAPAKNQTEKPSEQQTTTNQETQEQQTTQRPTEPQTTKEEHKHSYSSSVIRNATCTESGTITYTCSCGDGYSEDIPATGHVFGSYSYNNDATEYADGTETATCSVCGTKDTRTASGTKLVHNHNYTSTVTKNPACTEEGVTTYTCSCGHSYTESIRATGHSFGEYVYNNDATSESDGTKTAICLVCGVTDTVVAEGTKITLPSWYDEHPDIPLNVATGGMRDGSLEMYFTIGAYWTQAADGCWDFGYSMTDEFVGKYAEGSIYHGYLYKN